MSEKLKCILCVGISSSGKSTFAEEMVNQGYVRVERDIIRRGIFHFGQWSEYKFSKSNEERVNVVIDQMLFDASVEKKSVVISDTNLNPKHRNALIEKLERYGYEVEIKDFPISYEEAIKRDTFREFSVGQQVIYRQWQQWIEYLNETKYEPSGKLSDCVIFDIDGTLATMDDRGPFEWDKVGTDKPKTFIWQMLDGFVNQGYDIVFLSGRDSCCRTETTKWLNYCLYKLCDYEISASEENLFMRSEKDMRKDYVVKKELFWNNVVPRWDVVGVVDDRPQVLRLWYDIGVENVICVGNPFVEF